MCELKCIIHYKHLETSNEIITAVNEDTFKKLQESKGARLTLGGEYIHKEQIDNLPSSFIAGTQGFHRQCYQKFTNAVSVLKRKKVSNDVPDNRQRRSGQLPVTLFPNICVEIYIDNGSGKSRKLLHLNTCSLTSQQKKNISWSSCIYWK